MVDRRALILWNHATAICDAWLTFAADDVRQERLGNPGALQAFCDGLEKSLTTALDGSVQSLQLQAALRDTMKSDLLDALFNGDLIAVAYRVAVPPSRWPIIIDATAFDEVDPDWDKNTLQWRGQLFASLRVVDPYAGPERLPVKRKGRPSSGGAIIAAIDRVIPNHPGFCELPRAVAAELIRIELGKPGAESFGLSAENLARYIVQFCGPKRV